MMWMSRSPAMSVRGSHSAWVRTGSGETNAEDHPRVCRVRQYYLVTGLRGRQQNVEQRSRVPRRDDDLALRVVADPAPALDVVRDGVLQIRAAREWDESVVLAPSDRFTGGFDYSRRKGKIDVKVLQPEDVGVTLRGIRDLVDAESDDVVEAFGSHWISLLRPSRSANSK